MRLIGLLFLLSSLVVLAGCGGNTAAFPPGSPIPIGFSTENLRTVRPGTTANLLVFAQSIGGRENGDSTAVEATASGGATLSESSWTQFLGDTNHPQYHMLQVSIPQGATPGTEFQVTVRRSLFHAPDSFVSDNYTIRVGSNVVTALFNPASVQGSAGQTVSSTLTCIAEGRASGSIRPTALVDGTTFSASIVSIAPGDNATLTVNYRIPEGTPDGTVLYVPVVFRGPIEHGSALLRVQVGLPQQGDFTLGVSRQDVFVTPGGDSEQVTVTITPFPGSGFEGPVQVVLQFSDGRFSVSAPQTNPFTINVTSAGPATATFKVHMAPVPISTRGQNLPTVTVIASSGDHTHSQSINIRSS